jgi:hypothetical protein
MCKCFCVCAAFVLRFLGGGCAAAAAEMDADVSRTVAVLVSAALPPALCDVFVVVVVTVVTVFSSTIVTVETLVVRLVLLLLLTDGAVACALSLCSDASTCSTLVKARQ